MTDYTELVKALRCCIGDDECEKCPRYEQHEEGGGCIYKLNADAAAAIEALQAEVERLKDSNEELRDKQTYIDHYGDKWQTSAKDVPTAAYKHGYADGRDEAMAKMQKRNAEIHAELERLVSAAEMAGLVVRCKECIHFTQGGWCDREFDWFPVDENDFCSMAEKKEVQE